jgi:hypothetical protein
MNIKLVRNLILTHHLVLLLYLQECTHPLHGQTCAPWRVQLYFMLATWTNISSPRARVLTPSSPVRERDRDEEREGERERVSEKQGERVRNRERDSIYF